VGREHRLNRDDSLRPKQTGPRSASRPRWKEPEKTDYFFFATVFLATVFLATVFFAAFFLAAIYSSP
jgi:hypothetical protein